MSGQEYDVLDVCLSTAYRRGDWLPRMARSIARARAASVNDDGSVMVCRRRFYEEISAAARVGADGCCPGTCDLAIVAETLWQRARGMAGRH